MDFDKIIDFGEQQRASDVHFVIDMPIFLRIDQKMVPIKETRNTIADLEGLLTTLLTEEERVLFHEKKQFDFLHVTKSGIRLRGNVFQQQFGISFSFRIIPRKIRDIETIGFPDFLIEKLVNMRQGLVLVVGPTGQGKSTTLASILQERMKTKTEHVITVEDPIEYVLNSGVGVVQQREVGHHVKSFTLGLESALREDPDVLLVGEMRNLETISAALTMAETGHVVFSTLHTNNGPETITRIIDVFSDAQQDQIRSQLAATLKVIISQRLIPKPDGGLALAYEILTSNYAIQNYIRQNKIFQIPNVLQTDSSGEMVQFEQSLAGLVIEGTLPRDVAENHADDLEQFTSILKANGM